MTQPSIPMRQIGNITHHPHVLLAILVMTNYVLLPRLKDLPLLAQSPFGQTRALEASWRHLGGHLWVD